VEESIRARFGVEGLLRASEFALADAGPFAKERAIALELSHLLGAR
jgi:hypothetical protein